MYVTKWQASWRLTLRLHRRLVHSGKFGGEEGEVGHSLAG